MTPNSSGQLETNYLYYSTRVDLYSHQIILAGNCVLGGSGVEMLLIRSVGI